MNAGDVMTINGVVLLWFPAARQGEARADNQRGNPGELHMDFSGLPIPSDRCKLAAGVEFGRRRFHLRPQTRP